MRTDAVLLERPGSLSIAPVDLIPPAAGDVVVDVEVSGVSTGTERLLWSGEMPPFPGLGYPLVPGYEAVGRVVVSDDEDTLVGGRVFVPGASCYRDVRGLFGASAARLVVPARRAVPVGNLGAEEATLLALAATAQHALAGGAPPDLVVGHGALGRLLARLTIAAGAPAPTVWEREPSRRGGSLGYPVIDAADDGRRDYRSVYDVSGDASLVDALVQRLAPGGEVVLAGFYKDRVSFAFPPAFMREARFRTAAEWKPADMAAVQGHLAAGRLSLDGLVTHRSPASAAEAAYRAAFGDAGCLKMILDWSATR
ncbi:chlorophyll synthesis pathway protein BchC [Lichenibacterium dinghuense]|uniref:chlorophyll synthesis pathway protein BchC n=1 Tax=Lichenibacterium dinghuense TaxID=2895977 RepID=UPI001F02EB2A|nr:chlorophyll synthesis pathway protein BchC [Lichenibacterium sp. 6Y81]